MHDSEMALLADIYLQNLPLSRLKELIKNVQEAKANIDVKQVITEDSALMIAAVFPRREEMIAMLIGAGANLNFTNKKKRTALFYAAQRGHVGNVAVLLEAGADPNIPGEDGQTALMTAAWWGHANVVEKLLLAGATTETQDGCRRTAFDLAIQRRDLRVLDVLLVFGARIPDIQKFRDFLSSCKDSKWKDVCYGICHRQMGEMDEAKTIYEENRTFSVQHNRLLRALLLGESFSSLHELVACREQLKKEERQQDLFYENIRIASCMNVLFSPPLPPLEEEKMVHGRKPKNPCMSGSKTG